MKSDIVRLDAITVELRYQATDPSAASWSVRRSRSGTAAARVGRVRDVSATEADHSTFAFHDLADVMEALAETVPAGTWITIVNDTKPELHLTAIRSLFRGWPVDVAGDDTAPRVRFRSAAES